MLQKSQNQLLLPILLGNEMINLSSLGVNSKGIQFKTKRIWTTSYCVSILTFWGHLLIDKLMIFSWTGRQRKIHQKLIAPFGWTIWNLRRYLPFQWHNYSRGHLGKVQSLSAIHSVVRWRSQLDAEVRIQSSAKIWSQRFVLQKCTVLTEHVHLLIPTCGRICTFEVLFE